MPELKKIYQIGNVTDLSEYLAEYLDLPQELKDHYAQINPKNAEKIKNKVLTEEIKNKIKEQEDNLLRSLQIISQSKFKSKLLPIKDNNGNIIGYRIAAGADTPEKILYDVYNDFVGGKIAYMNRPSTEDLEYLDPKNAERVYKNILEGKAVLGNDYRVYRRFKRINKNGQEEYVTESIPIGRFIKKVDDMGVERWVYVNNILDETKPMEFVGPSRGSFGFINEWKQPQKNPREIFNSKARQMAAEDWDKSTWLTKFAYTVMNPSNYFTMIPQLVTEKEVSTTTPKSPYRKPKENALAELVEPEYVGEIAKNILMTAPLAVAGSIYSAVTGASKLGTAFLMAGAMTVPTAIQTIGEVRKGDETIGGAAVNVGGTFAANLLAMGIAGKVISKEIGKIVGGEAILNLPASFGLYTKVMAKIFLYQTAADLGTTPLMYFGNKLARGEPVTDDDIPRLAAQFLTQVGMNLFTSVLYDFALPDGTGRTLLKMGKQGSKVLKEIEKIETMFPKADNDAKKVIEDHIKPIYEYIPVFKQNEGTSAKAFEKIFNYVSEMSIDDRLTFDNVFARIKESGYAGDELRNHIGNMYNYLKELNINISRFYGGKDLTAAVRYYDVDGNKMPVLGFVEQTSTAWRKYVPKEELAKRGISDEIIEPDLKKRIYTEEYWRLDNEENILDKQNQDAILEQYKNKIGEDAPVRGDVRDVGVDVNKLTDVLQGTIDKLFTNTRSPNSRDFRRFIEIEIAKTRNEGKISEGLAEIINLTRMLKSVTDGVPYKHDANPEAEMKNIVDDLHFIKSVLDYQAKINENNDYKKVLYDYYILKNHINYNLKAFSDILSFKNLFNGILIKLTEQRLSPVIRKYVFTYEKLNSQPDIKSVIKTAVDSINNFLKIAAPGKSVSEKDFSKYLYTNKYTKDDVIKDIMGRTEGIIIKKYYEAVNEAISKREKETQKQRQQTQQPEEQQGEPITAIKGEPPPQQQPQQQPIKTEEPPRQTEIPQKGSETEYMRKAREKFEENYGDNFRALPDYVKETAIKFALLGMEGRVDHKLPDGTIDSWEYRGEQLPRRVPPEEAARRPAAIEKRESEVKQENVQDKEEPKPAPKEEEPKPAPKEEEPKPAPKEEEPKPAPKEEEPKPQSVQEKTGASIKEYIESLESESAPKGKGGRVAGKKISDEVLEDRRRRDERFYEKMEDEVDSMENEVANKAKNIELNDELREYAENIIKGLVKYDENGEPIDYYHFKYKGNILDTLSDAGVDVKKINHYLLYKYNYLIAKIAEDIFVNKKVTDEHLKKVLAIEELMIKEGNVENIMKNWKDIRQMIRERILRGMSPDEIVKEVGKLYYELLFGIKDWKNAEDDLQNLYVSYFTARKGLRALHEKDVKYMDYAEAISQIRPDIYKAILEQGINLNSRLNVVDLKKRGVYVYSIDFTKKNQPIELFRITQKVNEELPRPQDELLAGFYDNVNKEFDPPYSYARNFKDRGNPFYYEAVNVKTGEKVILDPRLVTFNVEFAKQIRKKITGEVSRENVISSNLVKKLLQKEGVSDKELEGMLLDTYEQMRDDWGQREKTLLNMKKGEERTEETAIKGVSEKQTEEQVYKEEAKRVQDNKVSDEVIEKRKEQNERLLDEMQRSKLLTDILSRIDKFERVKKLNKSIIDYVGNVVRNIIKFDKNGEPIDYYYYDYREDALDLLRKAGVKVDDITYKITPEVLYTYDYVLSEIARKIYENKYVAKEYINDLVGFERALLEIGNVENVMKNWSGIIQMIRTEMMKGMTPDEIARKVFQKYYDKLFEARYIVKDHEDPKEFYEGFKGSLNSMYIGYYMVSKVLRAMHGDDSKYAAYFKAIDQIKPNIYDAIDYQSSFVSELLSEVSAGKKKIFAFSIDFTKKDQPIELFKIIRRVEDEMPRPQNEVLAGFYDNINKEFAPPYLHTSTSSKKGKPFYYLAINQRNGKEVLLDPRLIFDDIDDAKQIRSKIVGNVSRERAISLEYTEKLLQKEEFMPDERRSMLLTTDEAKARKISEEKESLLDLLSKSESEKKGGSEESGRIKNIYELIQRSEELDKEGEKIQEPTKEDIAIEEELIKQMLQEEKENYIPQSQVGKLKVDIRKMEEAEKEYEKAFKKNEHLQKFDKMLALQNKKYSEKWNIIKQFLYNIPIGIRLDKTILMKLSIKSDVTQRELAEVYRELIDPETLKPNDKYYEMLMSVERDVGAANRLVAEATGVKTKEEFEEELSAALSAYVLKGQKSQSEINAILAAFEYLGGSIYRNAMLGEFNPQVRVSLVRSFIHNAIIAIDSPYGFFHEVGHFIWKYRLTPKQKADFIKAYVEARDKRFNVKDLVEDLFDNEAVPLLGTMLNGKLISAMDYRADEAFAHIFTDWYMINTMRAEDRFLHTRDVKVYKEYGRPYTPTELVNLGIKDIFVDLRGSVTRNMDILANDPVLYNIIRSIFNAVNNQIKLRLYTSLSQDYEAIKPNYDDPAYEYLRLEVENKRRKFEIYTVLRDKFSGSYGDDMSKLIAEMNRNLPYFKQNIYDGLRMLDVGFKRAQKDLDGYISKVNQQNRPMTLQEKERLDYLTKKVEMYRDLINAQSIVVLQVEHAHNVAGKRMHEQTEVLQRIKDVDENLLMGVIVYMREKFNNNESINMLYSTESGKQSIVESVKHYARMYGYDGEITFEEAKHIIETIKDYENVMLNTAADIEAQSVNMKGYVLKDYESMVNILNQSGAIETRNRLKSLHKSINEKIKRLKKSKKDKRAEIEYLTEALNAVNKQYNELMNEYGDGLELYNRIENIKRRNKYVYYVDGWGWLMNNREYYYMVSVKKCDENGAIYPSGPDNITKLFRTSSEAKAFRDKIVSEYKAEPIRTEKGVETGVYKIVNKETGATEYYKINTIEREYLYNIPKFGLETLDKLIDFAGKIYSKIYKDKKTGGGAKELDEASVKQFISKAEKLVNEYKSKMEKHDDNELVDGYDIPDDVFYYGDAVALIKEIEKISMTPDFDTAKKMLHDIAKKYALRKFATVKNNAVQGWQPDIGEHRKFLKYYLDGRRVSIKERAAITGFKEGIRNAVDYLDASEYSGIYANSRIRDFMINHRSNLMKSYWYPKTYATRMVAQFVDGTARFFASLQLLGRFITGLRNILYGVQAHLGVSGKSRKELVTTFAPKKVYTMTRGATHLTVGMFKELLSHISIKNKYKLSTEYSKYVESLFKKKYIENMTPEAKDILRILAQQGALRSDIVQQLYGGRSIMNLLLAPLKLGEVFLRTGHAIDYAMKFTEENSYAEYIKDATNERELQLLRHKYLLEGAAYVKQYLQSIDGLYESTALGKTMRALKNTPILSKTTTLVTPFIQIMQYRRNKIRELLIHAKSKDVKSVGKTLGSMAFDMAVGTMILGALGSPYIADLMAVIQLTDDIYTNLQDAEEKAKTSLRDLSRGILAEGIADAFGLDKVKTYNFINEMYKMYENGLLEYFGTMPLSQQNNHLDLARNMYVVTMSYKVANNITKFISSNIDTKKNIYALRLMKAICPAFANMVEYTMSAKAGELYYDMIPQGGKYGLVDMLKEMFIKDKSIRYDLTKQKVAQVIYASYTPTTDAEKIDAFKFLTDKITSTEELVPNEEAKRKLPYHLHLFRKYYRELTDDITDYVLDVLSNKDIMRRLLNIKMQVQRGSLELSPDASIYSEEAMKNLAIDSREYGAFYTSIRGVYYDYASRLAKYLAARDLYPDYVLPPEKQKDDIINAFLTDDLYLKLDKEKRKQAALVLVAQAIVNKLESIASERKKLIGRPIGEPTE